MGLPQVRTGSSHTLPAGSGVKSAGRSTIRQRAAVSYDWEGTLPPTHSLSQSASFGKRWTGAKSPPPVRCGQSGKVSSREEWQGNAALNDKSNLSAVSGF